MFRVTSTHRAPHATLWSTTIALLLAAGCASHDEEPGVQSTAQQIRTAVSDDGDVVLGVDVLVTDQQGKGVPCGEGTVEVEVEISRNGPDGPWVLVDRDSVDASCVDSSGGDLALVIDNSGSESKEVEVLKQGARRSVERVVADGGRVSLVRVSTDSHVQSPLSQDTGALDEVIDDLFVTNGWTALWDGVRMGNETLGSGVASGDVTSVDGAAAFCSASRRRGILLFTDGAENNSAHQEFRNDEYPGDGMDTSLEDLFLLNVGGSPTPIYAVGVGGRIDAAALSQLAERSGGRFVGLDDFAGLDDVLETIAQYFSSAHRFCSAIPSHLCGSLDVRVTHRWIHGDQSVSGSNQYHLDTPCDARAAGRVATILLTMIASETTDEIITRIVANTVNWVSPVDAPRVLFVLDDFHHGELSRDTQHLYERLAETGYRAEYMDEPADGLSMDDVAGFDVVWFSNPGYPIDDAASFNTLLQFSEDGGGVVFQGDDMSYAWGNAFATTPLTRLHNVDNGTEYCGEAIDNGSGGRYRVTLETGSHPVLEGLEGTSFLYGDDIDTATLADDGGEVLAWATVEGKSDCARKPVMTVYTPPRP
jgi:hypothetical protein